MSRLMSVSLTEQAVVERRKTVTRRLGWAFLKPGDRLTLCRKVMGRRPGEPLVRLAEVEVVSVRRERLDAMRTEDVAREAVPGIEEGEPASEWVTWFSFEFRCQRDTIVTRIEWRYCEVASQPAAAGRAGAVRMTPTAARGGAAPPRGAR